MLKAKDIMVKEAKAKEIMTKQVISVRKDTPVSEALELLWKNNITGVPVVEDDMTLVGVLTEKDVLTLFWAHEDQKNETVSSFMTQPALHFDENDALASVCECLRNYDLRRVPVTSKGKVVGIISRADMIGYILRQWQANIIPAAGA
jgi:CBS domain-containing protein